MAGASGDVEPALGVARSLNGRRWQFRPHDASIAGRIKDRMEMPVLVSQMIAARHDDPASLETFLAPTLRASLPDPSSLTGMEAVAGRIADAILANEAVAVFADYDVDGATSAALVVRYFAAMGQAVRFYVPDRITEGYGPNATALGKLADEGAGLIICVDCGIAAHEALASHAQNHPQCQLVVIDHHQAGEELPPALGIVNPNRLDDASGLGALAAVGVTFMTLVAVARNLRQRGAFKHRPEPDLLTLLDLVALGTVADVVPLTGLNRTFVVQGLAVMANRQNEGLNALARIARLTGHPGVTHLGFQLAPRINAGGRVGRANLGLRLLTTTITDEAEALAAELERLNQERKTIEAAALGEALAEIDTRFGDDDKNVIVAVGQGWHPGVVGLVAARLKDRYRRPAIAITVGEDGIGRGSARSMPGVDIGAAITAAGVAGIVQKGGGHAMAAGLTISPEKISALGDFLDEKLGEAARNAHNLDRLSIDAPLSAGGANEALMAWLDRIGPFGSGMPEPRFVFPAHTISFAKKAGENHIRLTLKSGDGATLDAMAFRQHSTPLGEALMNASGAPMHIAGKLVRDNWQGRARIKMFVDDAAPARA